MASFASVSVPPGPGGVTDAGPVSAVSGRRQPGSRRRGRARASGTMRNRLRGAMSQYTTTRAAATTATATAAGTTGPRRRREAPPSAPAPAPSSQVPRRAEAAGPRRATSAAGGAHYGGGGRSRIRHRTAGSTWGSNHAWRGPSPAPDAPFRCASTSARLGLARWDRVRGAGLDANAGP